MATIHKPCKGGIPAPVNLASGEETLFTLLCNLDEMASQDVSLAEIQDDNDQDYNVHYLVLRGSVDQWCNPKFGAALKHMRAKLTAPALSIDCDNASNTDHTHELSDSHSSANMDESMSTSKVSELDEEFHDGGATRRGIALCEGSSSHSGCASFDEPGLLDHFEKLWNRQNERELQEERQQRAALEQELRVEREHRSKLEQQLIMQQDQLQRQQKILGVFHDRIAQDTQIQNRLQHEIAELRSEDHVWSGVPCINDSPVTVKKSALNMLLKRCRSDDPMHVINRFSTFKGQEHWFV